MDIYKHKKHGLVAFDCNCLLKQFNSWVPGVLYRQVRIDEPEKFDDSGIGKGKAMLIGDVYCVTAKSWKKSVVRVGITSKDEKEAVERKEVSEKETERFEVANAEREAKALERGKMLDEVSE